MRYAGTRVVLFLVQPMSEAHSKTLRCAARGVKKSFGSNPILRGVDLEIAEGSFAVLVGPSGCGKSTLLRLVAGLEGLDEGTISLAGRDVTELPPRDRDVAMVFQSYALYPHMSVAQNIEFPLKARKYSVDGDHPRKLTAEERSERVAIATARNSKSGTSRTVPRIPSPGPSSIPPVRNRSWA